MSTGTVWNYRDFIKREHGSEEAIEFEIAVRKYQAEQIGYERERIIKLLEEQIVKNVVYQHTQRMWNGGYASGQNEWNGGQDGDQAYLQSMAGYLISLIKGEQN